MLLSGDMWQLKPVSGLALFASPSDARSQTAYLGCMLIWKSVRRCWELIGSKRCNEAWYNDVLRQCRNGDLTEDTYWYLLGLPTGTPTCDSNTGDGQTLRGCTCQHLKPGAKKARVEQKPGGPDPILQPYGLPDQTSGSGRNSDDVADSKASKDALQLCEAWVKRFVEEGATGEELVAT